jgi:hypothetical protein
LSIAIRLRVTPKILITLSPTLQYIGKYKLGGKG